MRLTSRSVLVPTILALAVVGALAFSFPPTVRKPKEDIKPGRYENTIKIGEMSRSYYLHVPPGYSPSKPTPVVFVLHGFTSSAKIAEAYTGMVERADKQGYIAVFPDGSGKTQGWNSGFLNLGLKDVDDVAFINGILDKLTADMNVDSKRVFIAGHSSGGMMSHLLGSRIGKRIAAIAPVSGTIGMDVGSAPSVIPDPEAPVSVIMFHSIPDAVVAYDHGKALVKNCYSAPSTAKWWAEKDGCNLTPKHSDLNSSDVTIDLYSGGKGGTEVELVTSLKGSHDWPGGGAEKASGIIASEMIFEFFKTHPKK